MSDDDKTLWCGNISEDVTEELLYELFIQAGPLEKVSIPKKDGRQRNFCFIKFRHVESVPYTLQLMQGVQLFGRQVRLQVRPGSVHEKSPQQNQQSPRTENGQRNSRFNSPQQNSGSPGNEMHRSNTWPKMDPEQNLTNDQSFNSDNNGRQASGQNFIEFGRNDGFVMQPPSARSRAYHEEMQARLLHAQAMQMQMQGQMQQNYQRNNYNRNHHHHQQAFHGRRW